MEKYIRYMDISTYGWTTNHDWIFPYMEKYIRIYGYMTTCKEGVTEPTTELEFSERKTTEEVPYLGFNILFFQWSIYCYNVSWDLNFVLWLWKCADTICQSQYILTLCPRMLQLQPAHCQCRLEQNEGNFQSSQWDVRRLVQLGEEKNTTHFHSFQ